LLALAANVRGTGGNNVLTGTESRVTIDPFDSEDTVLDCKTVICGNPTDV
jgi:hypothetical protein